MSRALRAVCEWLMLGLLALFGVILLAGSPASGGAEQDPPEQGVGADVTSQVSWGSAGGCIQNIQTNNFGDLTPQVSGSLAGVFDATPQSSASVDHEGNHVWVGCVTSNGPLVSVVAQGIQNMHNTAGDTLPLADVAIGITNTPGGKPSTNCGITPGQPGSGSCTLPADASTVRPLVGEQPAGTTELDWQYQLSLPAGQPPGAYRGGEVVFTATASPPEVLSAPVNSTIPEISPQTPKQGSAATATEGTWSNSPATYAYQWERCNQAGENCSEISGATTAQYTPTATDVGERLRVRVTAANSGGEASAESALSEPVQAAVPANTLRPSISPPHPEEGVVEHLTTGTWTNSPTSYSYEWQRCDEHGENCTEIEGASEAEYLPVAADVGHTLAATVTATNSGGSATASASPSEVVALAPPIASTPPPLISGTTAQGHTLSTTNGTFGAGAVSTYAYQWQTCDENGEHCTDIEHATQSTYTLGSTDVGHRLLVQVTASNAAGSASESSQATTTISGPPINTEAPALASSTPVVGVQDSVSTGTWTESPTAFAYQWQLCESSGEGCVDIGGATSASYTPLSTDAAHTLRVEVTASGEDGTASALSNTSGAVGESPQNVHAPVLSAEQPVEGEQLSVSSGTWSGTPESFTYTYQWLRCDTAGEHCADIAGAEAASYTPLAADVAHTLIARVTATNSAGMTSVLSETSDEVLAGVPLNRMPPSTTPAAARQGVAESASTGTWTESPTSYAYQWERCNELGTGCLPIAGASGSKYTPGSEDVGDTLIVEVTATNTAGSGFASSSASDVVLPAVPVNTAAPVISSESPAVGVLDSVSTGTWSNSPTSFTYQWQDCNSEGEGCSSIAGATASSYTPQASDAGHTLLVDVVGSNAGGSSAAAVSKHSSAVTQAPAETAPPTLSTSSPTEGVALSVSNGTWTGYPPPTFTYQWQRCNSLGASCLNISGATNSSYTPVAADVAETIQAVVKASNSAGSSSASTAVSNIVTGAPADELAPELSSSAPVEGTAVSVTAGTWRGYPVPTYSYQWLRCNSSGESCVNITGATSSSYTPVSADVTHTLRAKVTATNSVGSSAVSTSASSVVVPPAPVNSALPTTSPSIALVQQAESTSAGTVTLGKNVTASDLLVLVVCQTSTETTAVTGGGVTWRRALQNGGKDCAIWYGENSSGGEGTREVQVTGTLGAAPGLALSEWSGVAAKEALDSTGAYEGSATPLATAEISLASAGELIIVGDVTGFGSTHKVAPGFTSFYSASPPTFTDAEYLVDAKGATVKGTWEEPISSYAGNAAIISAFKGPPTVGRTVTAATGTWTNSPTAYTYQWEDCNSLGESCLNISGATSSTYTPVTGDVGYTLRVIVTASNAGGSGTATSAATSAVTVSVPGSLTGPTISPTSPQQGVAESTTTGTWSNSPTSYTYQWEDCNSSGESCTNISGATSSSYTPLAGDVGHTLRVDVIATNVGGSGTALSKATVAVLPAVPVNTAAPAISSENPAVGALESASTGSWTNSPSGYSYQWLDCNSTGEGCSSISGATASSYTPQASDAGHTLVVDVIASNTGGSSAVAVSKHTNQVTQTPSETVPPALSTNSPSEGVSLSVSTGTWAGYPAPTYTYQWQRCNAFAGECANISGATSSSYTPVAADVSQTIQAVVKASNSTGSSSATTPASNIVTGAPANTQAPSLPSSAPVEGTPLSISTGAWHGYPAPTYSYQWLRCNSSGESCVNITGATSSSYTPVEGDVAHKLQAQVTATNSLGSSSANTNTTGVVLPLAPSNTSAPVIANTAPQQGISDSVSTGTWSHNPVSYSYQWEDCNSAGENCTNISGANSSSYTPVEGDVGHELRVKVTASNAGGSGNATSEPTAVVVPPAPADSVLPVISPSSPRQGVAESTTTGTWSNSPTGYTYQWEDCNTAGESCTSISGATSSSYTPVEGDAGHKLRVKVTATNAGGSGNATSEPTAVVVPPAPTDSVLPVISPSSAQQGVAESTTTGTWSNSPTSYAYQWEDCNSAGESCSNISAATSSSYTPAASDVGDKLRVKVTATNAGGSGNATSEPTAVVVPPAPVNSVLPGISPSSPQQGVAESTTNGTWSNSPTSYAYQWEDCNSAGESCSNISGATSSGYTPVEGDAGHKLRVKVTATNAGGSGNATSEPTAVVVPPAPADSVLPVISSSSPQQGVVESTTNGTWSNSPTSYTYQWQDCNTAGESCTSISGATSSSYTPVSTDVGDKLRVKVTATNAGGSGNATSEPTAVVVPPAPVNSVLPGISPSSPQQGVAESTTNGTWSNSPTSYVYQWEDCNSAGESCSNISGATSSGYTPVEGDVGHKLRVKVTATNAGGSGNAPSEPTAVVVPLAPTDSVLPVISPSSPQQGVVESTTNGTWSHSPTSYAYQWEDCNSAGESCSNISGATSSNYTPASSDVGDKLRVKVTATNAGGSGIATSEPTAVVVPPAPVNSVLPVISPSSPKQGVIESATTGTWSNSPTAYSYQWEDCNSLGEGCLNISGASSSSYTPAATDVGDKLRVKVTATNAGGSGNATSEPTAVVVPPAPADSVLPVISSSSPQQGVVESTTNGTWSNSPTSYTYQWQDCNTAGESCTSISGATSSSYTPVASDVGDKLRVKVTATNAGGSGNATSEPTAVVVPPAPTDSVLPAISPSSPQQGVVESTTNGTWSNSPTSYAYQWEDCNSLGESCLNISGATSSSYTPAAGDVGDRLRVKVTASNAGGSGSAVAEPTVAVVPPAPTNSVLPVISPSSPRQGVAESTTTGTWSNSPTSYAYQWQDCNSAGESCSNISGATSSSYTPVEADAGHTLRVEVTATNSGGSGHAETAATATVLGKPTNTVLPAITESRTGGLGALNTADGTNDTTAVSCPSSGVCVAVDSSGNVLTTTNSGSSWTVTAISGTPAFVAVSCAPGTTSTSGLCAATTTSEHAYLATDPTGGAADWVESASFIGSAPPGGIACANTAFCVAVAGGYTNIGAVSGTAVTWTENSANASSFAGVSCTSETFCAHIDSSAGVVYTTTPKTIAAWTATSGVTLTGGTGEALSCAPGTTSTSGLCVDVGTAGRIAVTTDPAGTWTTSTIDGAHTITSVSCASTSLCMAVDNAGNVLISRTPAEASSWSLTGSGASDLTGASCYSTTFCVIVDNSGQDAVYSGAAVTTLKGSSGTWTNSPTSYTYQWQRCNSIGAECSSISGATSASRTETTEDAGHTLRIEVTATNAVGSGTATSSQSLVGGAPVNTAVPAIEDSGPGTLSEPYTADQFEAADGVWANEPTSYTYQWEDCNAAGESCSNISGATGAEYEPASADIGHTLRVVITVTNSDGSVKVTTTQTGIVKLAPPVDTVLPAITGSPVVAQVLTSSTGTWSNEPTSYTYQWEDCNSTGEACTNISGATTSSYTVASTDVGHTIRVVVTATNSTGSTTATSTDTARVASAAPVNTALPAITGTAKVDEKLTASTGTWSNEPTSYKYQWERCNSVGAECSIISGATSASRTETTEDAGHTLRIEVTATNAAGSTKATSTQTGVVGGADFTQTIDANALEATSCVPSSTDCVVSDNKGNAYYSTTAKVTGTATWNSWTGPSASASEALACPSTSLCTIADGGNVYYATSLGGSWTEAFSPSYRVDALTCASSSFCIDGQGESGGYIRYSTVPASAAWNAVLVAGSNNVTGVSCVSSSFCAAVDSAGEAYIAVTEADIKIASGWKGTDVDSSTALDGVACMSTTSCVAVDDTGDALALTINSEGAATVSKHDIDGTNDLTAVACTGSSTCAAVDTVGNVFLSVNAGATWTKQYALGVDLTSVSCSSASLCVAAGTNGSVTTFEG